MDKTHPTPETDYRIRLSLSGGSGMPIQTLLDCPQKFKHILDGWRQRLKPIYFIEGSVFHRCAEDIILNKGFKTVEDIQIYSDEIFSSGEFYDADKDKTVKFDIEALAYPTKKLKNGEPSPITKADQARKRLPHMLMQVALARAQGRFTGVKAIERLVQVDTLIDPETGMPDDMARKIADEGIVFSGTIDIDRGDRLEDLKTCSPSTVKKLTDEEKDIVNNGGYLESNGGFNPATDIQLHKYGYFKTVADAELVEDVGFHIFTKHVSKCEYIPLRGKMSVEDHSNIFELAKYAGRAFVWYEANGFPKHGYANNCRNKFGQECEFKPICFKNKYADPIKAMSNLKREG